MFSKRIIPLVILLCLPIITSCQNPEPFYDMPVIVRINEDNSGFKVSIPLCQPGRIISLQVHDASNMVQTYSNNYGDFEQNEIIEIEISNANIKNKSIGKDIVTYERQYVSEIIYDSLGMDIMTMKGSAEFNLIDVDQTQGNFWFGSGSYPFFVPDEALAREVLDGWCEKDMSQYEGIQMNF